MSGSGAASAATLSDAVAQALATNPTLKASLYEREAADWRFLGAEAGYFPQLDVQLGQSRERLNDPSTRARQLEYRSFTHREGSVTLTQMVFDSFRVSSNVRASRELVAASAHRAGAAAEQLGLLVTGAYLEVLRRQQTQALAQDNLAAHERIEGMIRQRVEGGVTRRSDLSQAESRRALARSRLLDESAALADAITEYQRLVGMAPTELSLPDSPPVELAEADAAAVSAAIEAHPAVRAARAEVRAAEAQVRLARAGFGPQVNLEVLESKAYDEVRDDTEDSVIGLSLRLNLFNGGADRAALGGAGAVLDRTRVVQASAERDVESGLRTALNALQTARERSVELDRYVGSITLTQRAYAQQFDIGQRSLVDLVNAQDEQFSAQLLRVGAAFTERLAQFRVVASQGRLLPALGVAPPSHTAPTVNRHP